ncbi:hypothetical protein [Gluconobacter kanchanaburiensis]|uniref:DUF2184 domain-containing protein n=1 Tax=Gluconobacter kanchanaburiensis NBRC 103587 TaxID=1307948 RepID=A0A511B8B3_9PROT|nr:hypothetical protein [Gluconobacter kanchanaburiensis]MBF0861271.1 hypothetical protein [Gluconobacter kanchanaburiensis]GBR70990.1 hypothetical protein AA103587_2161 [Gluconobacter kanchanaburiensis NBRC 103587]GEK95902.1 DUF2184 domain-containing protein [Gluconobacter kanchanaburiensis NBRC 103587]
MASFRNDATRLAQDWGINLPGVTHYVGERGNAYDAAPTFSAVTAPNSGIPAVINTMVDPQLIRQLITPTKSEEIYGSQKKGERAIKTVMFPVIEASGYAVAYGDFEQAGDSSANANWVNRQSFTFQTWAKYGDLEAEMMGMGSIDWVAEQRTAGASVLEKQQNLLNLFGLTGLENYGALNDPALPAAITASVKAGTSTAWTSVSDPNLIYPDFVTLFAALNKAMMGNINNQTRLKVVVPSELSQVLTYTNQFGITLEDMLKKAWPKMEIEFLPEAGVTMSGGYTSANVMQMFVPEVDGVETVTTAFTERLTMHRLEQYSTNARQKMSRGGWGTVWKRPMAVAQMVGI